MKTQYTIEVRLPREHDSRDENIGLIGNVLATSDAEAIEIAKQYAESSWQGYRVHPTELSVLKYFVKTRAS